MKLGAETGIPRLSSLLRAAAVPPPSDREPLSQGPGLSHQTGDSCFSSVVPEGSASRVCFVDPLEPVTWMPMDPSPSALRLS